MSERSIYARVAALEEMVARLAGLVEAQADVLGSIGVKLAVDASIDRAIKSMNLTTGDGVLAPHLQKMVEICHSIAEANLTSLAELRGPSRERGVAWPRHEAMSALDDAGYSLTEIGRFFSRDYSTVTRAIAAHRARSAEQAREAA